MLKVKKSRKIARHFWPQKVEQQPEEEKTKRIYASTKMTQKRQPKRVLLYIFVLILKLSFGGIFVLDFLDSRLKSDFCLHLNFRAKISKYLKFCAKISHEFLSALNGLSLASLAFL